MSSPPSSPSSSSSSSSPSPESATASPSPPAPARPVPWFEAHHRDVFRTLPPPTADAAPYACEGWHSETWTPTPDVAPVPRARIGNVKAFKGSGSYTRDTWRREQLERSKSTPQFRGTKRDGEGNVVPQEPTYYRSIKTPLRFYSDLSDPVENRRARHRQENILATWMGSARYTYNAALRGVQKDGMPLTLQPLRDRYANATSKPGAGRQPKTAEAAEQKAKRDAANAELQKKHGYEVGDLILSLIHI